MHQLHAIVSGRVQGVSFRYYTTLKAQTLGLTGWVRNLSDGRVETLAVGEQSALDDFLTWLHQGSSTARVLKVDATWTENVTPFDSFEIRN